MMEGLTILRRQIDSLSEFHNLVRALRALAGTHAREAQAALAGTRAYLATIEDAISRAAELTAAGSFQAAPEDQGSEALLVVLSEHGFVGGYNDRLIERALTERRAHERVIVAGRHGARFASECGLTPDATFPMATHVGGVGRLAREIGEVLSAVAAVRTVFARHRQGGATEIQIDTVLPAEAGRCCPPGPAVPPLHHLAPEQLMAQLTPEYLFAVIARVLVESLASENVARLRSMENANNNIREKLASLRQKECGLRQEEITEELLEIMTGAEAVADGGG